MTPPQKIRNIVHFVTLTTGCFLIAGCMFTSRDWTWDCRDASSETAPPDVVRTIRTLSTNNDNFSSALITIPYDGTIFPPEIAPSEITWTDTNNDTSGWVISIEFAGGRPPLYAYRTEARYMPDNLTWEAIKTASSSSPATITVHGLDRDGNAISRTQAVHISTSQDRVDATILYRQVPLPFQISTTYFKRLKWRMGDVASHDSPPVIMENLSTCASCHMATKDGSTIAMEMNYKGDIGAHLVAKVDKEIALDKGDFMTWADFPKPELLPKTRGLLAKISPDGSYMVSTVNELAFAAVTNETGISQLFFPTYGALGWYSIESREFALLPGASDTDYVQTDPSWSWDGKEIAFSRAPTKYEYHEDITRIHTRFEDENIHELNAKYPIQFNIYTVPFNKGMGGKATPLKGASHNGMSNYFPRFSPDGEWIVFTQSKSGIMLQPDSELYIVPAEGGTPRKMNCNRAVLNSWHSFSPNGKWLVFSSKVNSPFTEIFLTHIDENGMDSPPVLLSRFSDDEYAANLPEFVNIKPGILQRIKLKHN